MQGLGVLGWNDDTRACLFFQKYLDMHFKRLDIKIILGMFLLPAEYKKK